MKTRPMADDQNNDAPAVDMATPTEPPKPRGRWLLRFFVIVGVVGCVVLGVLLQKAHERELDLRAALSESEYERAENQRSLDRTQSVLQRVEGERSEALRNLDATRAALRVATDQREQVEVALEQSEAGRSSAENSLSSLRGTLRATTAERDDLRSTLRQAELARDNATRALAAARAEASECNDALENAVSIARRHRDKLDEIASAIRIGMIGVADIPSKGFVFSSGYDLESEYRKVVKEYNDLVDRFNAAVERSNDLGEIVNRVIDILR
jgi:hypothetical protein